MCYYPRIIPNKRYRKTKKNQGIVPDCNDSRALYVAVGCGDCKECLERKKREWTVRLMEDIKHTKGARMVTLTFSNESIRDLANHKNVEGAQGYYLDNAIATQAVRYFTERWRKEHKKTIRHWLVTELGHQGTENIHLHGIIWAEGELEEVMNKVERIWKYGWIYKGERKNGKLINWVNAQTVNYSVKYVMKRDLQHKNYKPIILTSNGIGGQYKKTPAAQRNKYDGSKTEETYITGTGHKIAMPIYWRNGLYTEDEREQLWLAKLDKEERYVNKMKIDISEGMEEYYEAIKHAQKINKQKGYGNGIKNWSRETYEQARRQMIIQHRIDTANKDNYPKEWDE